VLRPIVTLSASRQQARRDRRASAASSGVHSRFIAGRPTSQCHKLRFSRLSLPPVVSAALKSHHARQRKEWLAAGCAWPESAFVFCTPIGTPVDPRNATREFHVMRREAGLETTRFHDLRHTAATLLLAMGVDPRTIMTTLGHSQISPDDEHLHARPPGAASGCRGEDERDSGKLGSTLGSTDGALSREIVKFPKEFW
jgi:hypothetical protein